METKSDTTTIHSREGSNKYVHTVLGGELVITFVEQNADDVLPNLLGSAAADSFDKVEYSQLRTNITFERDGTGELFDGSYTLTDLSKLAPILALEDEVRDLFAEKPRMIISDTSVCICYEVHGRKKKYPIALKLTSRKYSSENADIIRLQTENRVLRKRLEKLENQVNDRLDELTSAIGAIKDLLVIRLGGDVNTYGFLEQTLKYGSQLFPTPLIALMGSSDQMWNGLIANGYADGMVDSCGEHILTLSLEQSPAKSPMMIDRLMRLVDVMRDKTVICMLDGKSFIQKINELLSGPKLSTADRAAWTRLHNHAVARGFQ